MPGTVMTKSTAKDKKENKYMNGFFSVGYTLISFVVEADQTYHWRRCVNAVDPFRVKCLFSRKPGTATEISISLFIDGNSDSTSASGAEIVLTSFPHKSTCFMNNLELHVSHFKQDKNRFHHQKDMSIFFGQFY